MLNAWAVRSAASSSKPVILEPVILERSDRIREGIHTNVNMNSMDPPNGG